MKVKHFSVIIVYLGFLSCWAAYADPVNDGWSAFTHGDYQSAWKLLQPLADKGNPDAQVTIGVMYAFGKGVPEDDLKAVEWYEKAAKQNNAQAQLLLGQAYAHGIGKKWDGVKLDYSAAMKWFRISAESGNAAAASEIAGLYRSGHGVTQSWKEAYFWDRMAAMRLPADASAMDVNFSILDQSQDEEHLTADEFAEVNKRVEAQRPKPLKVEHPPGNWIRKIK